VDVDSAESSEVAPVFCFVFLAFFPHHQHIIELGGRYGFFLLLITTSMEALHFHAGNIQIIEIS
jgi:hypothetical protein